MSLDLAGSIELERDRWHRLKCTTLPHSELQIPETLQASRCLR